MSLERLQKARAGLITQHPFFGMLSLRLDLIEDEKIESHIANGKTLRVNPTWAEALPMDELEASIAHQVLTCGLGHHTRRNGRDEKTWNEASDYAINAELKLAGFRLPPGSLVDTEGRFAGLHAEAIYAKLKENEPPKDSPPQPGAGQPDKNGSPQPQNGQDSPDQGEGDAGAPAPGQDAQDSSSGAPQPGSGASATGSFDDAPAKDGQGAADEAEQAAEEADWQVAVAQAAQASRGAGKLPGCIERAIEGFLNPKVAWQEALQRYFSKRAKDDYSWARPNRNYLPLYLPSLDSQRIGDVAIAIDCSGSIDQKQVDQFVAEIEDIRQSMRPSRVIVMMFDTRVRKTYEFGPDEPMEIKSFGGGGTAFDDPVRVLDEMGITPEVLVYLTDLDSSAFPVEPTYPVLWVTTLREKAPFGEVIKMEAA
jgi:predicted metal-dependent peptidase